MHRALCLLLAVLPFAAHAQSGEWGSRGVTRHFVARSNRVFAADGRGVAVYEVSGAAVQRLSVAETRGESLDVALIDDSDLAVATRNGMERFAVNSDGALTDLANYPGALATIVASNGRYLAGATATGITVWTPEMDVVAAFPLSTPASALAWHGDTLIAAVPGVAIQLFDIAHGAQRLIPESGQDVAVSGDRLYIAGGVDGVIEYDLTDESAPRLVSRTAAGDKNFTRIAVAGTRIVAAEVPKAIDVFDETTGSLVLASQFDEPVNAIAASGSQLFVSGTMFDRFGLPTETGAPLRVFDLSDATAPQLTGEFRDLAGPVSGVATDGTLAYVIDRPYFRVIDVSSTASPREIASLRIDAIGDRVTLRDGLAMLFGRGEVQIVDVSNPYAPRLLRTWDAQGGPPSNAAFTRDKFVEANPYSGFHVVDFTSFAAPEQIGGIKGHYYNVISDGGDVVYVSQDAVTLVAVDVSDVHNPRTAARSVVAPLQGEIAAATGSHPDLLVLETKSGVRIYSLADKLNPADVSFTPTSTAGEIAVDGDTAYLATAGAVQTFDLRDPAHPSASATPIQPVSPMQMSAAKGKVVIADRYSLRVFGPDTAPPPLPPVLRRRAAGR